MFIRNAEESDLKPVADIEAICSGKDGATLEEFQEYFSNKSNFEYLQISELSKIIVGFVGYTYKSLSAEIYIWNLAVSPEYRKKGFARALVTQVLNEAKSVQAKKIFLKVSSNNEAAINLYESLGFKKVSEEVNYYPDGSTCLILQVFVTQ